jgi:hypothetical protein
MWTKFDIYVFDVEQITDHWLKSFCLSNIWKNFVKDRMIFVYGINIFILDKLL